MYSFVGNASARSLPPVWYSVKTLVVADQVDVAGRFLEDRKLQMTDRELRLLDHELANFVT